MMLMSSFFLCIIAFTIVTFGFASTDVKYEQYVVAQRWKLTKQTQTKSVASGSLLECAIICTNDTECCTASYNKSSHTCDMNLGCCPKVLPDLKRKTDVLQRIPDKGYPKSPADRPKACSDLPVDRPPGVYTIYPDSTNSFEVYCEDGWTIFQRHEKPGYHFAKTWNEYKTGFGDLRSDHWLGNDKLHILTSNNGTCGRKMKVVLSDFNGKERYGLYHIFHIGDELSKYMIYIGGYFGGNLYGNAMQSVQPFSTTDQDNDDSKGYHCAKSRMAGWWFDRCGPACLNGPIRKGVDSWMSMYWTPWRGTNSLKSSKMLLK